MAVGWRRLACRCGPDAELPGLLGNELEQYALPGSRLGRLRSWSRISKWRRWLILYPFVMLLTAILIILWIAVAYGLGSTDRVRGPWLWNAALALTPF